MFDLGRRWPYGWRLLRCLPALSIHWAVHSGSFTAVALLIALGANPRTINKERDSPLHLAVQLEPANPSIIKKLVYSGCDTTL